MEILGALSAADEAFDKAISAHKESMADESYDKSATPATRKKASRESKAQFRRRSTPTRKPSSSEHQNRTKCWVAELSATPRLGRCKRR